MDSCTHSHAHIHMHTCASAEAQDTETSCCSVEIIALCWAGRWLGFMGRSQMYSAFIMLKHFNLRGKKCHFTLSALINRAFPPPAISQFCLQAHPIPTLPMPLQIQEIFFFILSHSRHKHKIFFFLENLELISGVFWFNLHYICLLSVSCLRYSFWKGLPVGHPRKYYSEVWDCEYIKMLWVTLTNYFNLKHFLALLAQWMQWESAVYVTNYIILLFYLFISWQSWSREETF